MPWPCFICIYPLPSPPISTPYNSMRCPIGRGCTDQIRARVLYRLVLLKSILSKDFRIVFCFISRMNQIQMNFCILLVPLLIKRVPYGNIFKQFLLLILMPQKERIYALNATQKNLITFRRGISGKINQKKQKKIPQNRVFKKIGIFGGYS